MNEEQESEPLSSKVSKHISAVDATVNLSIEISDPTYNPRKEISPSSSAYVSALQSPCISPKATGNDQENKIFAHPSTTTTTTTTTFTQLSIPESQRGSHSDDMPGTPYTPQTERYDFSDAKLRSYDVYIGYHGENPNLIRFCRWLKSELELQGIACFVADRVIYADSQSHEIANRVICSVTFGIVVVTKHSLLNQFEEIRFFALKKNLIPIFFRTNLNEVTNLLAPSSDGKDCKEAIESLMKFHEFKLEVNERNWRNCVSRAVAILTRRKSEEIECSIPFPKNRFFIGRETEIAEIETAFFGFGEFAVGKYKSFRRSVVSINGGPGMGKTEVGLEFAHRYSQRYKMVIWVGGEAQHFKQNVLNLSSHLLGLDLSADSEKERGRIRSFNEQETEAFKLVQRELFREIPYLLIIDNLETEEDLHNLIPKNTGSSHVIITTRLEKVINFEPIQIQPLPLSDAMLLIEGRRRKEYSGHEVESLRKFDEELGRSSFGLSVIGSLLSEMTISPSTLFQAINQITLEEASSHFEEPFWRNNRFLLKVLIFCVTFLQEANGTKNHIALQMLLAGAWFAASPVSTNLLAVAGSHMSPPVNRFKKWAKFVNSHIFTCSGFKTEENSALVLVNLGLVRRTNLEHDSCIMFHPITQIFAKREGGLLGPKAMIQTVRKIRNPVLNSCHLWASVYLVFGFKTTPPLLQLKVVDLVDFIKNTVLPLAICAFTTFSRCNSALELLKVCTNALEEAEKSLCWKKKKKRNEKRKQKSEGCLWREVTLLKATLLEMRAKMLLRGGDFEYGEELCRSCISIRMLMLGHNHAQTLAAQDTLSKLVRIRCKI